MKEWIFIIVGIVLFLIYRRSVIHKAGKAVGRAKAKIPGSQSSTAQPRIEGGLSRDFSLLDLKPAATFDEVKNAYRELAKVWHPDRFGSDKKLLDRANSKLGEINAAYERLKNHFGK